MAKVRFGSVGQPCCVYVTVCSEGDELRWHVSCPCHVSVPFHVCTCHFSVPFHVCTSVQFGCFGNHHQNWSNRVNQHSISSALVLVFINEWEQLLCGWVLAYWNDQGANHFHNKLLESILSDWLLRLTRGFPSHSSINEFLYVLRACDVR